VLRTGFTLAGVRHGEGKDVTVTVKIDGVQADQYLLAPHKYWMERPVYKLPDDGATHKATIVVQTAEHGWRELMMEGDVLGKLPEVIRRWTTRGP